MVKILHNGTFHKTKWRNLDEEALQELICYCIGLGWFCENMEVKEEAGLIDNKVTSRRVWLLIKEADKLNYEQLLLLEFNE